MGQSNSLKSNDILEEAYDDLPYESYSYPQTHPERLSVLGKLFSLATPDFERARILEIGCAAGGNVIPLAMLYPESKIVGIDLSGAQIELANAAKKAMGLKNIEFRKADITKLPADLGAFDYIICHGVFSWVPDFVREAIFETCKKHLNPDGLAIVSFNALPGWAAVKSLREMMIYHTKNFPDPAQKINEARQLLNFLSENATQANDTYRQIIDAERQILNKTNDSYIFHEHLEAENHQFYFHEFMEMANRHALSYVGDAELPVMYLGNFNEKVRTTLGAINDIVRQEQYLDFLTNRRFRQTILTHTANAYKIVRNVNPEKIFDFHIMPRFKPETGALEKNGSMRFVFPNHPAGFFWTHDENSSHILKAFSTLTSPVLVTDFAEQLQKEQGISTSLTAETFRRNGFPLTLQGFMTLHLKPYTYCKTVSGKPKAFAYARYVANLKKSHSITNLKREPIALDPFPKTLLSYLDGKKTHADLVDLMCAEVVKGNLKIHKDGDAVTDEANIKTIITAQLPHSLEALAGQAFLVS